MAAKKPPGLVPVSYRIGRETRARIKALADATGMRTERLVDQLLTAALDAREALARQTEQLRTHEGP